MSNNVSRRDFVKSVGCGLAGLSLLAVDGCGVVKGRSKKYLILDSGHGGNTTGATALGVNKYSKIFADLAGKVVDTGCFYEDEIAYDVLSRVVSADKDRVGKDNFEVLPIIIDEESGHEPLDVLVNGYDEHVVKDGKSVGCTVGNRVNAVNALRDRLVNNNQVSQNDIYLLSVHVNSESMMNGGAFFVYPSSNIYGNQESERKSVKFGQDLLDRLKDQGVSIHGGLGFKIDDLANFRIMEMGKDLLNGRSNRAKFTMYDAEDRASLDLFGKTPGIERKVILEIGNMKSPADLVRLNDPKYREKIASGIMDYMYKV